MPKVVDREQVRRMVSERDAQVVEVLPAEQYRWAHIDRALHLPLDQMEREAASRVLDRRRPVIVYCNDFL